MANPVTNSEHVRHNSDRQLFPFETPRLVRKSADATINCKTKPSSGSRPLRQGQTGTRYVVARGVTNSEHTRQVSDRQLLPPVISSVLTPPILPRGIHVFIAPIPTADRVPRNQNSLFRLRDVGMRSSLREPDALDRSVDCEAPSLPDVRPSRFPASSSQEAVWLDEIAACFTPGRPPSGLESL